MANHGEIDEGFVMTWVALMVAHPTAGQENEALGRVAALDDRERQSRHMAEGLGCGSDKVFQFADGSTIGKNDAQAQQQRTEDTEHDPRRIVFKERRASAGVSRRPRLRGAGGSMMKGSSKAHSASLTSLG